MSEIKTGVYGITDKEKVTPLLLKQSNGATLEVTPDYQILINGYGYTNPQRVCDFLVRFAKDMGKVEAGKPEPVQAKPNRNWLQMVLSAAIAIVPKLIKR